MSTHVHTTVMLICPSVTRYTAALPRVCLVHPHRTEFTPCLSCVILVRPHTAFRTGKAACKFDFKAYVWIINEVSKCILKIKKVDFIFMIKRKFCQYIEDNILFKVDKNLN